MRAVEISDRDVMRDHAAEPFSRKPGVKVKRRWLDLERRLAQMLNIEVDGVIGGRTDRGWHACNHRQDSSMNVSRGE